MTNPLNATTPDLPWYYCAYRSHPTNCTWSSGPSTDQTRIEARKLLSNHMNEVHHP